jgi:peptidoglycan-N-acetylmuramic acid deacetylase
MSSEKAKEKILSNIHNGAILLLHPTSSTNANILKDIITELKSQGYSFGDIYELVAK